MKIINLKTHQPVQFKTWKFPGGEIGFRIEDILVYPEVRIVHRIVNSDDLMTLLLATDCLRRMKVKKIDLVLPYVPYARQDRKMLTGESLSIKVFADIINSQNYDSVSVLDVHSTVTSALINNVQEETNHELVKWAIEEHFINNLQDRGITKNYLLIAPDAGASKKIEGVAKYIGYDREIVTGKKNRELSTGKIISTSVDHEGRFSFEPACFIIDDICDGGRTFIELAKVLRAKGAGEIYLIVTHGIFSAGFHELSEWLDGIYTTNSFRDVEESEYSNTPLKLHQYKIY